MRKLPPDPDEVNDRIAVEKEIDKIIASLLQQREEEQIETRRERLERIHDEAFPPEPDFDADWRLEQETDDRRLEE